MRPEFQVFLSGCLTFGIPLVLAFRELRLLRRGGFWRPDPPPNPQPKPLPPCLLVPDRAQRHLASRTRERELV